MPRPPPIAEQAVRSVMLTGSAVLSFPLWAGALDVRKPALQRPKKQARVAKECDCAATQYVARTVRLALRTFIMPIQTVTYKEVAREGRLSPTSTPYERRNYVNFNHSTDGSAKTNSAPHPASVQDITLLPSLEHRFLLEDARDMTLLCMSVEGASSIKIWIAYVSLQRRANAR